jgi:membrane protease YdiL (CAAX protease family)
MNDRGPFTGAEALILFGFTSLLFLFGGGLLAPGHLAGTAAAQWLLMALPLIGAARLRGDLAGALGLRRPSRRGLVGAALVGLGVFAPLALVATLQERLAPMPADLRRSLEELVTPDGGPGIGTYLAIALTPAVCEELLCRGVVARALRLRLGVAGAVTVSALLFALLHLSPYRFLPQLLLGIILGTFALRLDSVWPAMVIHGLSNATVIAFEDLEARGMGLYVSSPFVLVAGLSAVILGHYVAFGSDDRR